MGRKRWRLKKIKKEEEKKIIKGILTKDSVTQSQGNRIKNRSKTKRRSITNMERNNSR